ncbi:hypothetical protein B0H16DRAFT_1719148 [Mycena metata]|uniref:DUF6533 domain-containing protein n=1 Tax=Mycena metata TaxID=1033252 RepID=A0AAD7NI62_9AGAR|nr:hypothetical protein B0H16DRAFT_1719148 [Mycena metata]
MASSSSPSAPVDMDTGKYIALLIGDLIPLYVVLVGLTWILHDYFVTLEDEPQAPPPKIHYIWPQRLSFSKVMFFWVRLFHGIRESRMRTTTPSIMLLLFDVIQIHVFAIPGITNKNLCVAMDTIIRVVGAVLLWSVELIMQLRIYALYGCSKRIATLNLLLFVASIAAFLWILIHNHAHRASVIAGVLPLGIPAASVHSGIEWAQWVPAAIYEVILFGFALYKTLESTIVSVRYGYGQDRRLSIYGLLLRDNVFYFFGVAGLLVFNNLMVLRSPFHAAVGILTSRMMINLRKATSHEPPGLTSASAFGSAGTLGIQNSARHEFEEHRWTKEEEDGLGSESVESIEFAPREGSPEKLVVMA